MNLMLILLAFAAISMATIVFGDLRDSKTHRWKTVRTPRQRVGSFMLLMILAAFCAGMVLAG